MASQKHFASTAEVAGPSKKSSKCQVSKATSDKWQQEYEQDHQMLTWLHYDLDRDKRHMVSLYCGVCHKYEASFQSLKNFTRTWITGSTNQKVSNVLDHADSDVHKTIMARMKADTVKARGSAVLTSVIGRSTCTLDIEALARTTQKFELCFVMVKKSIAFNKYPALLQLEQHHGVDMGCAYGTVESTKSFIGFIAKSQHQGFPTSLSTCTSSHFFSVLMDGTTDAGSVEQELIAIPAHECLEEALKVVRVESTLDKDSVLSVSGKPVLIGVGPDGASVKVGEKTGFEGPDAECLTMAFLGLVLRSPYRAGL